MIDIVFDLYRDYVEQFTVVIHPSADAAVREHLQSRADLAAVSVLWQPTRSGMLDAVMIPRDTLAQNPPDQIWITWCDQVGVDPATIDQLAVHAAVPENDLVVPAAYTQCPYTYLERDADGRLQRILHQREGDAIPEWGEREMGVFALSRRTYFELLPEFAHLDGTGALTGERNFLPFLPWVAARGRVITFRCGDPREAIGVNSPEDRTLVEAFLKERRTTPRPVRG